MRFWNRSWHAMRLERGGSHGFSYHCVMRKRSSSREEVAYSCLLSLLGLSPIFVVSHSTTCCSSISITKKFRAIHCGSRRRWGGVKSNLNGCCVMKAKVMCSMAITGFRLSCDEKRWQKAPP